MPAPAVVAPAVRAGAAVATSGQGWVADALLPDDAGDGRLVTARWG
ncbi:hypothetical protein ACFS33_19360 [Cellulomonas phragmiteti]